MQETVTELAEKFAPENGNWYIEKHRLEWGIEFEVGMDTLGCFNDFVNELKKRDIDYGVVDDGEHGFVAYVYV